MERSLTNGTASATDNIQTSALNAQNILVGTSNEVSAKIKSTSSEIERSVFAASGTFSSTMSGKTGQTGTYGQQQTDRLSQMIESKRGSLVDELSARTTQLTVDIDRVTTDALKPLETRGQAFAHSTT